MQKQPPAGSCHYRYEKGEPLEDPACNPGVLSPAVTQANLASTICRKGGYTKNIRSPEAITRKENQAKAALYGYKGSLGDADQCRSPNSPLRQHSSTPAAPSCHLWTTRTTSGSELDADPPGESSLNAPLNLPT